MKEPTMEEVLELVEFDRSYDGDLFVKNVKRDVQGKVKGDVWSSVGGYVWGTINKRKWQFIETPKEKIIRLIREGKSEEALEVLEEE